MIDNLLSGIGLNSDTKRQKSKRFGLLNQVKKISWSQEETNFPIWECSLPTEMVAVGCTQQKGSFPPALVTQMREQSYSFPIGDTCHVVILRTF